jgi:hypothetical protein
MRTTRKLALVVVAVIVVMAAGTVAAYAALADDKTPPVTTTDAAATYFNDDDVAITVSATDNEGVAYIYHELDNGVARLNTVTGAAAQTVAPWDYDRPLEIGEHTLKYWSQDVNGNVEKQHTVTFVVKADNAAPTTVVSGVEPGAWYGEPMVADLVADDGDGIGVASITYRVDGGLPTTVSGAAASVPVATDGMHTIAYAATDLLGHTEATQSVSVGVDTLAPATTASGVVADGWYNHAVTVDLAATDGGSGVASLWAKLDYHAARTVSGAHASITVAVDTVSHAADGPHTVMYKATDEVGNVASLGALTWNVDTRKPTPKAPSAASATRGKTATLSYSVADAVPSGGTATGKIVVKNAAGKIVKTLKFAGVTVNAAQTAKFTVPTTWRPGTYKFFVSATDTAGNTQTKVAVNKLVVK